MSAFRVADLAREAAIVVCCGSGGVGKTTTAAALAVEGARAGRRACVVTIDPAKRLADALGLESLTNVPGRVVGPWDGELWALMLDTKSTFDDLVTRHADTPEQAAAILDNRLYRNMSGALSGTQEYMAMEKLYELSAEGGFDLVVVDTPPSRNALDFLEAPRRLTRFLENRVFRLLMTPTKAYFRAVGLATQTFLRTVSKTVGADVVADAVTFFQSFEGMEQGFRERAAAVDELLRAPSTSFVLVTSPRPDSVQEARFFATKLADASITVDGLIVNRVHPTFGDAPAPQGLGDLTRNLTELRALSSADDRHLQGLATLVAPAPVTRVPFLDEELHDLAGLERIRAYL